ncbi:MAG: metallophosphoesterase [Actinomycetota bacterium]
MRVTAISDLHGAVDHLEAAARRSDVLLVLGDLINVLDYRNWDGILVEIFGREPVVEAAGLRAQGRFDEARSAIRRHGTNLEDFRERFAELARAEYERVFASMPRNSFVTFGNVDVPDLLRSLVPDHVRFVDGEAVSIGGMSFGFVGGGVRTPLGIPGEVSDREYQAKFDGIGPVDVICTHMPPRLPWYTYDVVAKKFEPGSIALIEYVQRHQPAYALFGHVHQPLVSTGNVGLTQLVNVGHFQAHGRGFTIEVPD